MPTKTKPEPLQAGDFAQELASKYGCGRPFAPVACWCVSYGVLLPVNVVMVRGHCDARESRFDYAETTDRDVVGTHYLFPRDTHDKPHLVNSPDEWGDKTDWIADRISGPRVALQLGSTNNERIKSIIWKALETAYGTPSRWPVAQNVPRCADRLQHFALSLEAPARSRELSAAVRQEVLAFVAGIRAALVACGEHEYDPEYLQDYGRFGQAVTV